MLLHLPSSVYSPEILARKRIEMKRVFSRCLIPAAILGILCTPLAAQAMPIVGDFSSSVLTDNDFTDFDVTISGAPTTGNVTDVSLLIGSLTNKRNLDYLNQTEAYLIFNSQTLLLWQGLTGGNMIATNFTDSATGEIDVIGSEPYTGSFISQYSGIGLRETQTINSFAGFGGISGFSGLNANGTWKLRIYDTMADGNVGYFSGGSLTVAGNNSSSNSVPVPPQFLATAIAGGLGALRARRQQKTKVA
jgi:hypothetical protein